MNVPNYADILPQLPPGRWARSACFPSMAALCFGEDSQENLHERAEHFHCKWFYEHLQCACWKDGSQHWVFLLITQGSVELTKTNQSLPPYSSMLTQTSSVFRRNDLIPELTLPERSNQLWKMPSTSSPSQNQRTFPTLHWEHDFILVPKYGTHSNL